MTVRLVSVDAIRVRMSLPEDSAIDAVINSAVIGTSIFMATKLKTCFDQGSDSDLFLIDADTVPFKGTYRLLLKNGFIGDSVLESMQRLGDTPVTLPSLRVNSEKGLITINEADLVCSVPCYVRVAYTYGFADLSPIIPDWLSEASLAYSVQLMSMQQLNDVKADTNGVLSVVKAHTNALLDPHYRNDPLAVTPIG